MNGNPKSSPSNIPKIIIESPIESARSYLDAFRVQFAGNAEVLLRIDHIEKKLETVRDWVILAMIAKEFTRVQSNSISGIAAALAANDDSFELAA
jgi:hypothetical protein